MKIQINDANYPHYKRIFEIINSHLRKLYPPELSQISDSVKILNSWESKSKTIAKRGLKAGLQDLISQIKEFSPDLKSSIEKDLVESNLPSLRELQGITIKTIARVLKRSHIKTLEEFYIIKEEVIDLSSDLTEEDRSFLEKLLTDFEYSKGK